MNNLYVFCAPKLTCQCPFLPLVIFLTTNPQHTPHIVFLPYDIYVIVDNLSRQLRPTLVIYHSYSGPLIVFKLLQLLQVLVESHQLLRLKPFRNEKRDPKYCLLQPSDLGPVPSETALVSFIVCDYV